MSQKKRKRIEEIFGWLKTVAGQRQTRFRGLDRVGMAFTFALAAYNLIRMPKTVENRMTIATAAGRDIAAGDPSRHNADHSNPHPGKEDHLTTTYFRSLLSRNVAS